MKPIYSIVILLFASCNENIKTTPKISFEDSLINTLIGKWGGSSDSLPVWEIRKDSIYYFEHLKAYPYKIKGQDIIINLTENQGKLENIHVTKDTLFFILHSGVEVQAIKFK